MNKRTKILLIILTSLIAIISAFLVYFSITSNGENHDGTLDNSGETDDFYDENVDPDGWI